MRMNQFRLKPYRGYIGVMDVMRDLKAINAEDEAYKYCYCSGCGYPRPDIVTLDSFKMYEIHEAPPDFKNLSQEERDFERDMFEIDGYSTESLIGSLCGDCLRNLIQMSYCDMVEPETSVEYTEKLTRAERINGFIAWIKANYLNLPHMMGTGRRIHDKAREAKTRRFLERFFSKDELSAAEIEGKVIYD